MLLVVLPLYLATVETLGGRVTSTWFFLLYLAIEGAFLFQRQVCRYPRCGDPFFHNWWNGNGFARRCVHCGLPKYATHDPVA